MADQRQVAFAGRVLIKLVRLLAAVVVGVLLWLGAIQAGVVRNPLDPVLKGDIELARSSQPGLRVLFVGNSFTYHNSLPRLVHRLGEGDPGGQPVYAVHYAAPNWRLKSAADDDGLDRLLREVPWDYVVLQEITYGLANSPERRRDWTDRYARAIAARVGGAEVVLFMTWGFKNGVSSDDSYSQMQWRLAYNYRELAQELGAKLAPVGVAWQAALQRRPGIDLWHRDGRHPGKRGSYLGACVFYAALTGRDPRGNSFAAGLDPSEARFLQRTAQDVVAYARRFSLVS